MRALPPAVAAFLSTRPEAVQVHGLVWMKARNRQTGAIETMGLWTGVENQQFDIGGLRDYLGAGTILGLDRIIYGTGLDVRMHSISLAAISPEVEQAIRGYDARLAPVEVHGLIIDPVSNAIVGSPWMVVRGWIDEIDIRTPVAGGEGGVDVKIASASRALTQTLSLKRGDASQALRSGDRFRRYAEVSGTSADPWGEA